MIFYRLSYLYEYSGIHIFFSIYHRFKISNRHLNLTYRTIFWFYQNIFHNFVISKALLYHILMGLFLIFYSVFIWLIIFVMASTNFYEFFLLIKLNINHFRMKIMRYFFHLIIFMSSLNLSMLKILILYKYFQPFGKYTYKGVLFS